jgi:hypothetical protein
MLRDCALSGAPRPDVYGEQTSRGHVFVDVAFLEQAPDCLTGGFNWACLRGGVVLGDLHGRDF